MRKLKTKIVGWLLTCALLVAPIGALAADYTGSIISGHAVKYAIVDMNETQARVMLSNGVINSSQALAGMAEANSAFAAINGTYCERRGAISALAH